MNLLVIWSQYIFFLNLLKLSSPSLQTQVSDVDKDARVTCSHGTQLWVFRKSWDQNCLLQWSPVGRFP